MRELEKRDWLSQVTYPESTNPVEIEVRDYVEKCKGGDIDTVTHEDLLSDDRYGSHFKAVAAEAHFQKFLDARV
ncbi:hypothetical protein KC722_01870 [Candidatus Kaiserbacteria bacterium]|nr:hypothetical protein [Candidatus Kaiserbacteria bacterium]